jgi:hypothetical protein
VPVETRMQAPVYHQHRPGLRRQVRLGALVEKCSGLRDGRPIDGYIKDPVRLHVKIAIARCRICMHELPPLFHIESHRLEGRVEHAGIGGKQQPARLAIQSSRQGGEIRIGSAV